MMKLIFCLLFVFRLSFCYDFFNKNEIEIWKEHIFKSNLDLELMKITNQYLSTSPNPIKKIDSMGRLRGDPIKEKSLKALEDLKILEYFNLSFLLTENVIYQRKILEFVLAWVKNLKSEGNPINDTKIENLLYSIDLIKGSISTNDLSQINLFLKNFLKQEYESFLKSPSNLLAHNFHNHRIKIIGMCSLLLQDSFFLKWSEDQLFHQINTIIETDGKTVDFIKRNALHYHCYTLEPLLKLKIILSLNSTHSFLDHSNKAIQKSINFLLPYVRNEKVHLEFLNTKIPFDIQRSNNLEPDFIIGKPFNPKRALDVLCLASYFDPSLKDTIEALSDQSDLLTTNAIYYLAKGTL